MQILANTSLSKLAASGDKDYVLTEIKTVKIEKIPENASGLKYSIDFEASTKNCTSCTLASCSTVITRQDSLPKPINIESIECNPQTAPK